MGRRGGGGGGGSGEGGLPIVTISNSFIINLATGEQSDIFSNFSSFPSSP